MSLFIKVVRRLEDFGYRLLILWQRHLIRITCFRVTLEIQQERKQEQEKCEDIIEENVPEERVTNQDNSNVLYLKSRQDESSPH